MKYSRISLRDVTLDIFSNIKGRGFKGIFILLSACILFSSNTILAAETPALKQLEKELIENKTAVKQLKDKINRLESLLVNKIPISSSEDSNERLDSLEDSVIEIEGKIGNRAVVNAFDGIKVDIGGFFHSAYTYIDAEDVSVGSFNRQNFELLISAELNKDWSAFFAGGFLREADDAFDTGSVTQPAFNTKNKTPLIVGWVNYSKSDAFNIRVGRFITPHGVTNIEHFPVTLFDPEQPQFLRPFGGDTIFPNFSTGIQIHGSRYSNNDHKIQYSFYISNFTGNPEGNIYGGMVEYEFSDNITAGINYANGRRASNDGYDMAGIHALYESDKFVWKTEYFTTKEELSGDRAGGYTQPAWHFSSKWSLFYRFDVLDNGVRESQENAVGLNYLPYSNVRLRAVYTQKTFDEYSIPISGILSPEANADVIQLSGTFSF